MMPVRYRSKPTVIAMPEATPGFASMETVQKANVTAADKTDVSASVEGSASNGTIGMIGLS
jgi:hypothetical protein